MRESKILERDGSPSRFAVPLAAPAVITGNTVRAVQRSWRTVVPADWDDFVCRTGGSFLGAFAVLRLRRLISRVLLFDFELSGGGSLPRTIARCAVVVRKNEVIFLDRVHILLEYQHLWDECFRALHGILRRNAYIYGSLWNIEDPLPLPAEAQIVRAPKRLFRVDIIETNRWADFGSYFRSASKTIRHDYKRAERSTQMTIEMKRGLRAIPLIHKVIECREYVKVKNGPAFAYPRTRLYDYVTLVLKIALFGERGIVAVARYRGQCLAAFAGIEFGNRLYYITGGTKPNKEGAGSFLTLTMIRYLIDKFSSATLVFGYVTGNKEPKDYDSGVALYRRKLRVKAVNGIYETLSVRG